MIDQATSYIYDMNDSMIITANIINQMLGLISIDNIVKFAQLIIANNPKEAIDLLEDIYRKSSNLEFFIQNMADFFAELSKYKIIKEYSNPLFKTQLEEISKILIGTSLSRLSILWQIFNNGTIEIKQSHNELSTAQMLIIKAIYSCNLPSAEELMNLDVKEVLSPNIESGSDIAKPNTGLTENRRNDIENNDKFFEFLKYCHANSEMKLYYYLLNEVEIKEFTNTTILIATKSTNIKTSELEEILKKWSNTNWKVSIIKHDNIFSLKNNMMAKVKESEDYQIIKNKFPDSNISDIILKS